MNKLKKKQERGITLIALVITIIVLLILAGITIAALTGENGLLNKATTAKKNTTIGGEKEKISLAYDVVKTDKIDGTSTGDIMPGEMEAEIKKQGEENVTAEQDGDKIKIKFTTTGNEYTVDSEGTITELASNDDNNNPPAEDSEIVKQAKNTMPTGAHILEGTNETTGIVMIDSKENEWVWIEVPETVFTSAQHSTDYANIKADLIAYATDYREGLTGQGMNWYDEWYNGCGLTSSDYSTAYQTMLSSVYTNKGFYISRYEIGDKESTLSNTTRNSSTGYSNTPVCKVDQMPYNYVTCSQAQGLANSMKTGSKNASLLFGIQWDLVCKYLEEKGDWDTTTHTKQWYIKTESTSWGNYKDSSLTLRSGKYNTSPSSSTRIWTEFDIDTPDNVTSKKTSNNTSYLQLLTTGASEGTNKMNIYDFAGNVFEWTLEYTTDSGNPCAKRGGGYSTCGYNFPAAHRSWRHNDRQQRTRWVPRDTLLVTLCVKAVTNSCK